jgi:hypothetical protein
MPNALKLEGKRFGGFVIVERQGSRNGRSLWLVQCDCGARKLMNFLPRDNVRSCGCRIHTGPTRLTHGHSHHSRRSPTYQSWMSMVQRCTNPARGNFKNYGGRGIVICERWRTFENFLADMGERPLGTTLDRVDVNGNYEPSNCRWVNAAAQSRNKRHAKLEPHEPAQIRWLRSSGYPRSSIAAMFEISESMVRAVDTGIAWK